MKVFLVGFGRTGTKTMAKALRSSGLNVLDMKKERINRTKLVRAWKERNWDFLFDLSDRYDVVEDHPWPMMYKELTGRYPQAKFIFTYRDSESWLRSIINHTIENRGPSENKLHLFGHDSPIGNEKVYLNKFEQHKKEIIEYFQGCDNFLSIKLGDPNNKKLIEDFLGIKNINIEHLNKSKNG